MVVTRLPLPCVLKNALAFISSAPRLILVKGLGHLLLLSYPIYFACLLPFCFLNQKPLNIYLSVFTALSLSRVTCQYLLILVGIDILIYRKATIDTLDLWVIKNRLLARLTGEAIPTKPIHFTAITSIFGGSISLAATWIAYEISFGLGGPS